jgi:hypothetical protein
MNNTGDKTKDSSGDKTMFTTKLLGGVVLSLSLVQFAALLLWTGFSSKPPTDIVSILSNETIATEFFFNSSFQGYFLTIIILIPIILFIIGIVFFCYFMCKNKPEKLQSQMPLYLYIAANAIVVIGIFSAFYDTNASGENSLLDKCKDDSADILSCHSLFDLMESSVSFIAFSTPFFALVSIHHSMQLKNTLKNNQ